MGFGPSGSIFRGSRPRSIHWRSIHGREKERTIAGRSQVPIWLTLPRVSGRPRTRRLAWLAPLEQFRSDLADEAVDRLSALEPGNRAEACEAIVQTAVDEVNETIAFLEDMPLRHAVKRLTLLRDDLETMAKSCRRWSRIPRNTVARTFETARLPC